MQFSVSLLPLFIIYLKFQHNVLFHIKLPHPFTSDNRCAIHMTRDSVCLISWHGPITSVTKSCVYSFSVSVSLLNVAQLLGRWTSVYFHPRESKEITSYVSTVVQNILRQPFIWSIRGPFERCCRTRSWRASPSDDKKSELLVCLSCS